MTILLERAWDILVRNRYPYFALNILYYGLIILLMAYAAFNTSLQDRVLQSSGPLYMGGALLMNEKTAVDDDVIKGLGMTFLVNVLR